jgi:hypothetical protein
MALVAIASAKGAPGATTTALALAALWPKPVLLLDADLAGGDVAVRMPAPDGTPVNPDQGVLSLAAAGRNGLRPELIQAHCQQVSGGLDVLAGLRGPEQGAGLEGFWPALAQLVPHLPGVDVIADLGRISPDSPVLPLAVAAQAVILVARPTVGSVLHVRERLGSLSPMLRPTRAAGPLIGVVLISDSSRDRDARAAGAALAAPAAAPDRVWQLALDPVGAGLFEGQAVRRPERSALVRSVGPVAQELAALLSGPAEPAGQVESVNGYRRQARA